MCGICGIVTSDSEPDLGIIQEMLAQLSHRGPDGSGYVRDHTAILGHTRLAIIDTAYGVQPLCNEDQNIWVTFNGEIFNYIELTRELARRGHTFRTASDTEVIVHAWEEWGPECFDRFNGQWAIGIWDRKRRTLTLSRDRMGVRPLYYHLNKNGIIFASEVKAIYCDRSIYRRLDPGGLGEVLKYWSTIAPRTIFAGISQLPPGHFAVFQEGKFAVQPYWKPDFPPRTEERKQDVRENAVELREHLIAATKLRFERSDVPVGAYLSGGIDSSITAAIIREFTDVPLSTFSVRFSEAEFDEGHYQRLMASRLGTNHQNIVVSATDIADVFPETIWHAEAPLLRAAPAPLFLLSRLVRDSGYKVVVTGEGADEILGGYDIYREARVREFWSRNPDSALRDRAAELIYPWMERNPGLTPAFSRSFFGMNLDPNDLAMSHRPRWSTTSTLQTLLSPEMRAEVTQINDPDLSIRMPQDAANWDPLARAQWLEITTLLPGYILASQGDRMLMANSVEGRFPFLDPNVVSFANNLPARHKLFGLEEKYLLKYAFSDLIPEEILFRPKQPYRAPDAASFFVNSEPEWLTQVTSPSAVSAAAVFDGNQVAGLLTKARRRSSRFGNTDNMRVLAILSIQLLHEQFIAQHRPRHRRSSLPGPLHVVDLTGPQLGDKR